MFPYSRAISCSLKLDCFRCSSLQLCKHIFPKYDCLNPYTTCSHLQVHFAEEWNELHHLQIMESLGGDQLWWDRFLAQHSAIFYFWVLILFYTFAPRMAYVFSELVEVSSSATDQVLGLCLEIHCVLSRALLGVSQCLVQSLAWRSTIFCPEPCRCCCCIPPSRPQVSSCR